ncbi:ROK family protein [Geosporobacter ferrireducens]|uniref:Sugar kinase n=1 Tax=Geosporobacter ferrireducens TaxID=1424294 RepID=A0A1D8GI81_9FIRM|nr:ROK family protein [Geosporobacter ferrireducens]AOT70623.1 sugar kinase [Geosporobacter ferrireducens]MTI57419.1 ROK family protein [Geosporobacter ferrireducens]
MIVLGFDIGGTKSAVVLAEGSNDSIHFLDRKEIRTTSNWKEMIDHLIAEGKAMFKRNGKKVENFKIGISCGGPLDSKKGMIQSPPNLPGWDNVPIIDYIYEKLGVWAKLQNDADACALAEWKYGAGRGYENLIFLTFGTGLGAGLILNGNLYTGASNMAGEVGHIPLEDHGPIGYGKGGSFEGFCSGGGIAQIAKLKAYELEKQGIKASFIKTEMNDITAKDVAESAEAGNRDALDVFRTSGKYFGRGLSIIIDILNPEIIVVGSIYVRAGKFLNEEMYKEIEIQALESSRKAVKIVPAQLGEKIGDYGAVVTALA